MHPALIELQHYTACTILVQYMQHMRSEVIHSIDMICVWLASLAHNTE